MMNWLAKKISKFITPYMMAGILVHEKNTWLTIYHRGHVLLHASLEELRAIKTVGDGNGISLEIEIETKQVTTLPPIEEMRERMRVRESVRPFEDR